MIQCLVQIYKTRNYCFNGCILVFFWLFVFLFQSCSFANHKLGLKYITVDRLNKDDRRRLIATDRRRILFDRRQSGGVFRREFWGDINNLREQGFLGESNQNDNINVRKHLMFVFFHCLRLKQESTFYRRDGTYFVREPIMMERILEFFGNNGENPTRAARGLMYRAVPVIGVDGQTESIKFIFPHLFGKDDPILENNLDLVNESTSPNLMVDDQLLLISSNNVPTNRRLPRCSNRLIEVDHLLKDNRITIELPDRVHSLKTMYLDKLLSHNDERVIRNPRGHWRVRLLEQRLVDLELRRELEAKLQRDNLTERTRIRIREEIIQLKLKEIGLQFRTGRITQQQREELEGFVLQEAQEEEVPRLQRNLNVLLGERLETNLRRRLGLL